MKLLNQKNRNNHVSPYLKKLSNTGQTAPNENDKNQRKNPLTFLYYFLSLGIIFFLFSTPSFAKDYQYIAHRADIDHAPSESYAAVDMAISKGYKAIECDIWKTHSGDYLIYHDYNLHKLCGVRKNICQISEKTRMKYPFKNKKYGVQNILTFSEMVEYAKQKQIDVYFHLKAVRGGTYFTKNDLRKIRRIIEEHEMQNNSYFISSNTKVLSNMRGTLPGPKGGLTTKTSLGSLKSFAKMVKKKYKCDFVIFKYVHGKTDKLDLIKFCHKLRLKVCYYNIKITGETKRLKKLGADMLILNRPAFAD